MVPLDPSPETIEWLEADPKNLLLAELFLSELQARRGGKRKTYDTHAFEVNLMENLTRLRDELWYGLYQPSRGTAHVVFDPVQREIFAAPYRDRVIHHWIVSNIVDWWEPRLIYDSYSCRIGKGTDFGIRRLRHHIQSVSDNFSKPCYVIKLDITGYFMHIKRDVLFDRVKWGLDHQFAGNHNKRYQMLLQASEAVIFDDPVDGVKINGSYDDWRGLPDDKSLFVQPEGCGLVIGNLTSQFYSNLYLDPLDRFITITLGYQHYGRYVDDFYIVVTPEQLPQARRDLRAIETFLAPFGMSINKKKTRILASWQGVPFLGMVVKHDAILPGKRIVHNYYHAARRLVGGIGSVETIVSYLGMLCHYDAIRIHQKIFQSVGWVYE